MTTYITYATGPGYVDEMAGLVETLRQHKLNYIACYEDDAGSWVDNCARKPHFLARMRAALRGPMIWLDADARVMSPPSWPLGYDFGYHLFRNHEVLSGTLYIGDTPGARDLLQRWCTAMDNAAGLWDQRTLAQVLQAAPDTWRVARLPESHACIDKYHTPGVEPVIWHRQASRRLKTREEAG